MAWDTTENVQNIKLFRGFLRSFNEYIFEANESMDSYQ